MRYVEKRAYYQKHLANHQAHYEAVGEGGRGAVDTRAGTTRHDLSISIGFGRNWSRREVETGLCSWMIIIL